MDMLNALSESMASLNPMESNEAAEEEGAGGGGGGGGDDDESGSEDEGPAAAAALTAAAVEVAGPETPLDATTVAGLYKQAATKFNIKQKDCIKFLIQKGLLKGGDAAGVARYLREQGDALSKRRIGEYLGNVDEFNQEVLKEFLNGVEFAGLTLDGCLRKLLTEFRLPGEAQQIDRILEKYAARVYATNTDIGFDNEDCVYILSFSLIMLNTDLHNPNIAENKKMTMEGFIRNNQGINNGKDIRREVLVELFQKIKKEEVRMNEGDQWEGEVVTFMAPNKSGWLQKKNHSSMSSGRWKKHWFVLSEHVLYYFDSPGEEKPRLILPMDSVRVGRSLKQDCELEVVPADGLGFVKCTKLLASGKMEIQQYKDFVMKAATAEERDEWYEALRDDLEPDPVQRMRRAREQAQRLKEKDRLKKSDSVSALKQKAAGKDSGRLEGRGLIEFPPPVAAGWMHKRGESMTAWKRRYFALIDCPEELGIGCAIYYFGSEKELTRMLEIGDQTQKGQLFLEHVKKVAVATDAKDKSAIIQLVCEGRTWKMRPETPESFNYWMEMLEMYVAKEKKLVKAKLAVAAAAAAAAAEEDEDLDE